MRTGQIVQKKWLYASDCCLLEVYFDSETVFTRCPRCASLCNWEKVDVTVEKLKGFIDTSRFAKPWRKGSDPKVLEPRHSC
jgi:hypothetical protein